MIFNCNRCGYNTDNKYLMIQHLKRKSPCLTPYSDVDREELLKQFERQYNDTAVQCPDCEKKFNHKSNLYAHKKVCKKSTTSNNTLSDTEIRNDTINVVHDVRTNNDNVNSIEDQQDFVKVLQTKEIWSVVHHLYLRNNSIVKRFTHSMDMYKNIYLQILENDKWVIKDKKDVFTYLIKKSVDSSIEFIDSCDSHTKEELAKLDIITWLNDCAFKGLNPKISRNIFRYLMDDHFAPSISSIEQFYQKHLERIYGCGHTILRVSGVTDLSTDKYHIELKNWVKWKEGVGQLICYSVEHPVDELRLYLFGNLPAKYKEIVDIIKQTKIIPYCCSIDGEYIIIQNMLTETEEKHSVT